MSGGGKQAKGGMASSLKNEFSAEEISNMQKERNRLQDNLEDIRKKREDEQRYMEEVYKDEGIAKSALQKQRIDFDMNKESYNDNEKKIE